MLTFVIYAVGIVIIIFIGGVMVTGGMVLWQAIGGFMSQIIHPKTREELEKQLKDAEARQAEERRKKID
jgi:hypothetical protein